MLRWQSRTWLVALAMLAALSAPGVALAGEGSTFEFGDVGQAAAAIIIFLLLLAVLGKWAWKPIVTQLANREEAIAKTIERAEGREQEAQRLLADYQKRLEQAQAQAQELMNQTRKEAGDVREQIVTAAREEARKSGELARQDLEKAKQDAMRELYDSAADMATVMASKIIRKNLRPEDQRQLINESLEDIRGRAARKS